MPTYASATNPFIKLADGQRPPIKKIAPGMARPSSLLDELNKCKEAENLLLDEPIVNPAQNSKETPIRPRDTIQTHLDENNNNGKVDEGLLLTQVDLNEKVISDEVAQTCDLLVEQAVKLSISEEIGAKSKDDDLESVSVETIEGLPPEKMKKGEEEEEEEEVRAPPPSVAEQAAPVKVTPDSLAPVRHVDEEEEEEDEDDDTVEENKVVAGNDKKKKKLEEETCAASGGGMPDSSSRYSNGRQQHIELIKKLRLQLRDLERYAHERGELERMPASVLLERQTVILESLRKKLPNFSLDKDKIEKLELDELKRQVDDEINNLIDPLMTKENLLKQLKTQLTDLEKYVSHLHGTLGISNASCKAPPPLTTTTQHHPHLSQDTSQNTRNLDCQCALHGCSSPTTTTTTTATSAFNQLLASSSLARSPTSSRSSSHSSLANSTSDANARERGQSILSSDTLPKTSRLIRGLMAQLICSDMKIQEAMRMEKDFNNYNGQERKEASDCCSSSKQSTGHNGQAVVVAKETAITTKPPQFHDGAAWTLHIDRVILATDSLNNIYSLADARRDKQEPGPSPPPPPPPPPPQVQRHLVDDSLVDSVVRRQLVPAMRDLLAYGLIDPSSLPPKSGFASFIFDPYYILSSLTCLPGYQTSDLTSSAGTNQAAMTSLEKVHIWHVIVDYFESRNEPNFKNSSIKTLSQSFNLTSTLDGPIKITSKQALLIAIDDIIERMAKCKPNGPESHFKLFVYIALNQGKLATWIKIIFRSKSVLRKYYHNFSFVCQADKMDRFLSIIDSLSRYEFKLNVDSESLDQFVSAF